MTTLKQQMTLDVASVFLNTDEFADTGTYTSPAGAITSGVKFIVAPQSFIQEFGNVAGMGATIVIPRAQVPTVAIHGKIIVTAGTFIVHQIVSSDSDVVTVIALGDTRISPTAMRS